MPGEPARLAAVDRIDIDVAVAFDVPGHGQRPAVRRPGRRAAGSPFRRKRPAGTRRHLLHKDFRVAGFKRHVGEIRAVRRPGRRHDGFLRAQHNDRVPAVRVRHHQPVLGAARRNLHVGKARGKHAARAGELFVREVRDPVSRGPQCLARTLQPVGEKRLARIHVHQLELNGLIGLAARHAAHQHRLHVHDLPVAEPHLGETRGPRDHQFPPKGRELPGALQIRFHNLGQVVRQSQRDAPFKRHHRNRNRPLRGPRNNHIQLRRNHHRQQRQHNQTNRNRNRTPSPRLHRATCSLR